MNRNRGENGETEKIRFDPNFMRAVQSWIRRLPHLPLHKPLQLEQLRLHSIDSWYAFDINQTTLIRLFSSFTNLETAPNNIYNIRGRKFVSADAIIAFKTKLAEICQILAPNEAINQALDHMDAAAGASENQSFFKQK